MAKEKFEDRPLTGPIRVACKYENAPTRYWETTKEEVIEHIVDIVNEYKRQDYKLTLRQLHYQFVTENWIVNHVTAYKKLGSILDDCRYCGIIDWDDIEDRGRLPYLPYWAVDLKRGLQDLHGQFRIDRQEGQEALIELWTEKDALSAILKRSTEKYHIQLVVNKGYTSSSAIYQAYERIADSILSGKRVTILYFGDHDPSGLDMVRDITDRLMNFLSRGEKIGKDDDFLDKVNDFMEETEPEIIEYINAGCISDESRKILLKYQDKEDLRSEIIVRREWRFIKIKYYLKKKDIFKVVHIGLTMEQIQEHDLPENPAKLADPRAGKYIEAFGEVSWEVDALKPQVLTGIVETHIEQEMDMDKYFLQIEIENKHKKKLQGIINRQ